MSDPDDEVFVKFRIVVGTDAWRLRAEYKEMFDYAQSNLGSIPDRFPGATITPANDDDMFLDSVAGKSCAPYIQETSETESILDVSHVIAGAAALWNIATQIGQHMPDQQTSVDVLLTSVVLNVAAVNHVMFKVTVSDLDEDADFHAAVRSHMNHPAYGMTNKEEMP